MTETQERFLRTVLTRVPLDSVVELHLFPPIRRGTLETGVAVIATVLPTVSLTVVDDDVADAHAEVEAAVDAEVGTEVGAEVGAEVGTDIDAEVDAAVVAAADTGDARADDDSPYSDASAPEFDASGPPASAHADTDETLAIAAERAPVATPRLRILTANYRHTIKGVERGKWTVDVQEEADAPLDAVEAVLRGVRHRSTEPADPELVTHDTLAALLSPLAVAPAA